MSDAQIGIITRAEVVATAPDRWASQYAQAFHKTGDKAVITQRLMTLKRKKGFTAEQVDEIIGNRTWTVLNCMLCREETDLLAHFESASDDYQFVQVCKVCIGKVNTLMAEVAA